MFLRTLLALLCLTAPPTALAGPLREQLQEWSNARQQPLPEQHSVLSDLVRISVNVTGHFASNVTDFSARLRGG